MIHVKDRQLHVEGSVEEILTEISGIVSNYRKALVDTLGREDGSALLALALMTGFDRYAEGSKNYEATYIKLQSEGEE